MTQSGTDRRKFLLAAGAAVLLDDPGDDAAAVAGLGAGNPVPAPRRAGRLPTRGAVGCSPVAGAAVGAVRRAGVTLDPAALRGFLSEQVAQWWLPDDVVFVDELPLTATGKLRRNVIRGQAAELLAGEPVER